MARQVQKQKEQHAQRRSTEDAGPAPAETDSTAVAVRTEAEEKMAALDDLLDEIDEVLEENALEFVSSFVQKGGQ